MSGKTERVVARVNPKTKEDAEKILNRLGLSMSDAIGLFLHQVIVKKGLPFSVVLEEDRED